MGIFADILYVIYRFILANTDINRIYISHLKLQFFEHTLMYTDGHRNKVEYLKYTFKFKE